MKLKIERDAHFSECRTWRYTLDRSWNYWKPFLLWILLNPATANAEVDDPTNRRGIRYAQEWGYGSLTFCNLFAFRTAYPSELKKASDPIGPDNDGMIMINARRADKIMIGWGNHGDYMNRSDEVLDMLEDYKLYCLTQNKSGQPKHPLYCKADMKPVLFER